VATIKYDGQRYPHILAVSGSQIVNNENKLMRRRLRNTLFSDTNPVGNLKGKVDFIVCFVVDGPGGDYDPGSIDHSLTPRPLRGIIQLGGDLRNMNAQRIGNNILGGGIAHEMGHYWLVPGKARIRTHHGTIETPTSEEIWRAVNEGRPIPSYPIIARQDKHWSPYIGGFNTPMDGINQDDYTETPGYLSQSNNERFAQVTCRDTEGPSFILPGENIEVKTLHSFSPLERWIMGDYQLPGAQQVSSQFSNSPHIVIPGLENAHIPDPIWPWWLYMFHVLEPRWVFPLSFQAGLYVELEDGLEQDAWYLGFHRGPHQIAAQSVDGNLRGSRIELPRNPFNPHHDTGLRVLQEGSTIRLQVRVWPKPNIGAVLSDLVGDDDYIIPESLTKWNTLATLEGNITRIGISIRNLEANRDSPSYVLLSAKLGCYTAGVMQSMSVFDLEENIPHPGPRRLSDGRFMMPYKSDEVGPPIYRERADLDIHEAPKWTTAVGHGDFAFGGVLKLESCLLPNWAGRSATNKVLVGRSRMVPFSSLILPWPDEERARKQEQPLDGKYKMLFCVAARAEQMIEDDMLHGLEMLRRAWEIYFPLITDTRRADTTIDL